MAIATSGTRLGESATPLAAGAPAQRAVARAPSGELYAVFPDADGGVLRCLRSKDGERWTEAAQSEEIAPCSEASLAIDASGHAHLVYAGEGPRYLYYRRGDPVRYGWDWSIRVRIFDVPELASANAVPHAQGDEWRVHVVWSRGWEFASAYYNRFKIDPEREIWLGTRERVAGPFDTAGHPAPVVEVDPETNDAWAAMWAGSEGVAVARAQAFPGSRWLWRPQSVLAGSAGALPGSVSALWTDGGLAVSWATGEEVVLNDVRHPVPATHTSLAAGPVVVAAAEGGPLYANGDEIHPGPVASFSCERGGAGVLVCAGDAPPYSVEFVSLQEV